MKLYTPKTLSEATTYIRANKTLWISLAYLKMEWAGLANSSTISSGTQGCRARVVWILARLNSKLAKEWDHIKLVSVRTVPTKSQLPLLLETKLLMLASSIKEKDWSCHIESSKAWFIAKSKKTRTETVTWGSKKVIRFWMTLICPCWGSFRQCSVQLSSQATRLQVSTGKTNKLKVSCL